MLNRFMNWTKGKKDQPESAELDSIGVNTNPYQRLPNGDKAPASSPPPAPTSPTSSAAAMSSLSRGAAQELKSDQITDSDDRAARIVQLKAEIITLDEKIFAKNRDIKEHLDEKSKSSHPLRSIIGKIADVVVDPYNLLFLYYMFARQIFSDNQDDLAIYFENVSDTIGKVVAIDGGAISEAVTNVLTQKYWIPAFGSLLVLNAVRKTHPWSLEASALKVLLLQAELKIFEEERHKKERDRSELIAEQNVVRFMFTQTDATNFLVNQLPYSDASETSAVESIAEVIEVPASSLPLVTYEIGPEVVKPPVIKPKYHPKDFGGQSYTPHPSMFPPLSSPSHAGVHAESNRVKTMIEATNAPVDRAVLNMIAMTLNDQAAVANHMKLPEVEQLMKAVISAYGLEETKDSKGVVVLTETTLKQGLAFVLPALNGYKRVGLGDQPLTKEQAMAGLILLLYAQNCFKQNSDKKIKAFYSIAMQLNKHDHDHLTNQLYGYSVADIVAKGAKNNDLANRICHIQMEVDPTALLDARRVELENARSSSSTSPTV